MIFRRRIMLLKWLMTRIAYSVLILSGILVSEAHAYIDPGSGSVLLQLILGGAAGVGVVVKLYWERVKTTCQSLFGRAGKTDPND